MEARINKSEVSEGSTVRVRPHAGTPHTGVLAGFAMKTGQAPAPPSRNRKSSESQQHPSRQFPGNSLPKRVNLPKQLLVNGMAKMLRTDFGQGGEGLKRRRQSSRQAEVGLSAGQVMTLGTTGLRFVRWDIEVNEFSPESPGIVGTVGRSDCNPHDSQQLGMPTEI
jgi:hypothetical protein